MKASTESEIDAALVTLVNLNADALLVGNDVFFSSRSEQIVALAARHAIPAIYQFRFFRRFRRNVSYGSSLTAILRQVGIYGGRILEGEKPTDLPLQQPTKFELVINLKTTKVLGLTVPQSIFARADEVIE